MYRNSNRYLLLFSIFDERSPIQIKNFYPRKLSCIFTTTKRVPMDKLILMLDIAIKHTLAFGRL